MKATLHKAVVAESTQTREVEGYCYFPRSEVHMELLSISPKTADDQVCPDGVQFYDLTVDGGRQERAAWSYEKPRPGKNKAPIDHWVAFWGEVKVGP